MTQPATQQLQAWIAELEDQISMKKTEVKALKTQVRLFRRAMKTLADAAQRGTPTNPNPA